ncbi:hypothetical protein [Phaeobacter sp. C3_T13_0]|uniref:hypothetical protein n=1 Tax=Phaeobacter cretensis TaxID=3342641 RepID=UPI0039BC62C4
MFLIVEHKRAAVPDALQTPLQQENSCLTSAPIPEALPSGWQRAKFGIKPDGSVIVDANMVAAEAADDFLNSDLRMGE